MSWLQVATCIYGFGALLGFASALHSEQNDAPKIIVLGFLWPLVVAALLIVAILRPILRALAMAPRMLAPKPTQDGHDQYKDSDEDDEDY